MNFAALYSSAVASVERMAPCCQVDHVIVDASNLLFRIGHMERGDSDRMAIMFLEKMLNLRQWYGAEAVHVVWEGVGKNWRFEILPSYKGGREQDSELRAAVREAIAKLRNILPMTTIQTWDPIDAEGDDGFAALAEFLPGQIGIYSTDRDLLQLASDRVVLIVPQRGEGDRAMGPAEVAAKLGGLPASKMVDVKGLQTDAGDNIPGVPGIGPKFAVALIVAHGSLDALLSYALSEEPNRREGETLKAWRERLRELSLTPKRLESLRTHAEQARVSRAVAGIRADVELRSEPQGRNPAALRAALRELGPSSYLDQKFQELSL